MSWLGFLRWVVRDARRRYFLEGGAVAGLATATGVAIVSPHRLSAGVGAYVDRGSYLHCGDVRWCPGQGRISIGAGSYVGPNCVLFGMGEIVIGEHVMISPNVVLTSMEHPHRDTSTPMYDQPRTYGRIVIEDDVYVGSSAVVTPGVTIGRGAVVGAGAVVTRDVPSLAIAVGVPARVVGTRGVSPATPA